MNTKLVSEWKLPKALATKLNITNNQQENYDALLIDAVDCFLSNRKATNSIASLLYTGFSKVESLLAAERWVCLDRDIFFDKKAKGFWMLTSELDDLDRIDSGTELSFVEEEIQKNFSDPLNEWSIPDKEELLCLTRLSHVPFKVLKGRPRVTGDICLYGNMDKCQAFDTDDDQLREGGAGKIVPFLAYEKSDVSARSLFITLIENGFILNRYKDDVALRALIKIFHYNNDDVYPSYKKDAIDSLARAVNEKVTTPLLFEEKIRADLSPYHQKIIEDTDLGHWSLWQDELDTSEMEAVPLPKKLVARDPKSRINEGVVAIDFGTKSTVVAYQKDNVNIHPMRIGTGDLSKDIAAHHYENPTIMEFVNLNAFLTAYHQKENKPDTRWCDLTISHTAQNSLQGSESSKFNTFLDALKQWAGDKNRNLKVVGQHGKIIDLPPFLSLEDGDFNPIEIYAYYLGLYINNLNNGIFMDYILSFPVTYEVAIRDKIIHSFRNGLKKSLPAELGKETINTISVKKGASEPAAYALTALQAYHIEPEGDERVFYSVFDFGGGTTDFDFGIYREPTDKKDRRRFDYVIEHFGAGGDKFLGGENLLELLAFEVFKKNKNSLLEQGIQFEKHPERDAFAGSEQLLSRSQEARTNTKQLCIALRPYWEEHDDFSFDASGELQVTLTDVNGVQHSAFGLQIDDQELNAILSSRIERGVENFFDALRLAFSNRQHMLSDISNVKIFLAGNASQSSFVRTLFDKHIALQHQEMGLAEGESRFELFQPLGVDSQDLEKPTGKTGVAFGLIESREGGRIKVIDHNVNDDDIRFKYYLGENRKKKFKPLIERDVSFNQWIDFTFADYQTFEIFYTDQPSTSTGQVAISDTSIKKKVIKLDTTDDDALVFIRVVSPTAIEYVIANEDDIHNDIYLNEINRIEL
ncbi:molecular chaperone DnaK [Salinivibrio sp. IB282]|uniref:molecular chaperone DnaK n=1 Tax=Salinivibrio sp. IB282 TaxID=1766122 RepID=UPI00098864EA|nr:molecular chaperone DnaK [Salinivibrio sp. IB282]OOE66950.1 molecular chaperone DnaK [Salinivibrio sp. IB282]